MLIGFKQCNHYLLKMNKYNRKTVHQERKITSTVIAQNPTQGLNNESI